MNKSEEIFFQRKMISLTAQKITTFINALMQYLFAERVCKGILNATFGFIVPPGLDGDGQYGSLLRCHWLIVAPYDKLIEFQVLYVDIKESQFCREEALVVKNFVGAMLALPKA